MILDIVVVTEDESASSEQKLPGKHPSYIEI
jgi:hypothetical protein